MTKPAVRPIETPIDPRDKLFIALDVSTRDEARSLVDELKDAVGGFKIGLQLFTAAGPHFVRELTATGARIFLDLKFHDIPNTVAFAAVEAVRLGVWMFNVHATGGREMMTRTRDAVLGVCEREGLVPPKVVAVTVLTSSDRRTIAEVGFEGGVVAQVVALARLAADCGLDGVVASAFETSAVRGAVGRSDFMIVTPGIRAADATIDDQKRVMTFARAMREGSDLIVVGRPVTQADDRLAAVDKLLSDAA